MPAALVLEEPLERLTLGERAYARIADLLISGRLAPGEKLSLRGAAEVLGVSIMPVRAAVSRLVADKALEVAPNRAIRVPVMSAAQFRDITATRIAIEGHAAALAAERRSDADLPAIAAAEEAMRAESHSETPDLPLAVEVNKQFHFAVYQAAKSPTLNGIIRALWLKVGPVINLDLRENPERIYTGGAVRFHAEILDAIVKRDPEKARAGIAADIKGASDFILSRGNLPD
ncbi:GntR family transcriptional regulator [Nitrobacteraceae bacterium UC4446_H13]|jgi:DNA-binding GntR family transcriptional regulator